MPHVFWLTSLSFMTMFLAVQVLGRRIIDNRKQIAAIQAVPEQTKRSTN